MQWSCIHDLSMFFLSSYEKRIQGHFANRKFAHIRIAQKRRKNPLSAFCLLQDGHVPTLKKTFIARGLSEPFIIRQNVFDIFHFYS